MELGIHQINLVNLMMNIPGDLPSYQVLDASYRDPCGFLFKTEGSLYRQINKIYQAHYEHLLSSGLYDKLISAGLLIQHHEVSIQPPLPELAYKIIEPELIPFISYPYEWSFSQYRDAALATLEIQKIALEYGMTLKDASAYNIQFFCGHPVLIDTLSFEIYQPGTPWIAYRQFCQHFFAPLSLIAYVDIRVGKLVRIYLDGMPLDLASHLLPIRTSLVLPILLHIHTHARSQKRYASIKSMPKGNFSREAMLGLIDNLGTGVRNLRWNSPKTEWGDYYNDTNYPDAALTQKEQLVGEFLDRIQPKPGIVWDLGANTGIFSRQASSREIPTIAFDVDPVAVEKAYSDARARGDSYLLPLILDLTNPSPAIGWSHSERASLLERGPADAVLALAVVHHLAISNNVPFNKLVDFFAEAGKWLIIEFVPKQDSQVQRLLASRQDIFPDYTLDAFETAFRRRFEIHQFIGIVGTERRLYLMKKI
jgi:hypothetical protein